MKHRIGEWALVALLTASCAMPSRAAADVALLNDLTAVIALLGMPCGRVVSATRLKDDDPIAICQDGTRYRVFMNAEGRVCAETQELSRAITITCRFRPLFEA